jgi:glycosyltransferase involved in cell wall biosynthesis
VNLANLPAANWLARSGTAVLINVDGQEWLRGKWGAAARWYFLRCAKKTRVSRATILNDCDAMAVQYLKEFGTRSLVANYCWTGIADGLDEPEIERRLERFGLRPREYFFLGGRLVPENNIAEIAESLSINAERHAVVVAGEANYDSPVKRALLDLQSRSSVIQLVGHVDDRRDYASLLAGARSYVHGHTVGGINPSLLEAMGCGAAIAAFDSVFNREALGEWGRYFSDPNKALDAVHAGRDDHESEARRAVVARVHERYSLERSVVEYEAALIASTSQSYDRKRPNQGGDALPMP